MSFAFPTCPDPVPSMASLTGNRGARPSVPAPGRAAGWLGAVVSTARKAFTHWLADRLP